MKAQPSGGYTIGSDNWNENVTDLWSFCLAQGYSEEAFAGMMGNSQSEGGMNPWRWQGDTVNYSAGYGLFQYTPAKGYINQYGKDLLYYAPNLSVTSITAGAEPEDGYAQILAIVASGKYGGGGKRDTWIAPYVSDYASYKTLDGFKTCSDVEKATYLWLGYFECPGWWQNGDNVAGNFKPRLDAANSVYGLITGTTPTPPSPDDPDRPHPQPPTTHSNLMYGGIRDVLRRLIIHA